MTLSLQTVLITAVTVIHIFTVDSNMTETQNAASVKSGIENMVSVGL